ncbi:DUF2087 domain-containing protein [Dictyobacter aurantiacus]|uniref:HTH arsR-type domain-containing protein n=1 Tax=Dictyobacter aurantiacus TaxID=1936993 RepID=A0A401ZNF6_9CHLR|nr:DUF2087 domain-containing protein [Dictyobacter aurantiacus]GCE08340.1 hypothetical protein KDAU_56690 [Dictyobacter aurantiacus]
MDFTSERNTGKIHVAWEPVSNALNSFALLHQSTQLPGLSPWVEQTASQLTDEQLQINRLLFIALRDALTPQRDEPNFPSYLHNLGELNAYVLRKRILEPLRRRFSQRTAASPPHTKYLITDVDTYLDTVRKTYGEDDFDAGLQRQAHQLLQDPQEMQRTILAHLETLWKTTFAQEWKRVQNMLRWQSEMFTNSLRQEATLEETIYEFTGRHLPAEISRAVAGAEEIILIPSWHTGRRMTVWSGAEWIEGEWGGKEVARIFFSEPPNYDVAQQRDTIMSRPELQARLGALADETRLSIIELLTHRSELHAQEIIAALDLSQSSVSRHLKQLVSMKYLYERRGEGANKTYRLSSYYLARTAQAVQQLSEEGDMPSADRLPERAYSQELKRFVDRSGRLTTWPPAKQGDKLLILEYLASFFEKGRMYSEKEVNALLLEHTTIKDAAALRRGLYEYRFMNRQPNGSQYWLIEGA